MFRRIAFAVALFAASGMLIETAEALPADNLQGIDRTDMVQVARVGGRGGMRHVGRPGVGVGRPGVGRPGVGVGRPGVGRPGVGIGRPGVGVGRPGIGRPGVGVGWHGRYWRPGIGWAVGTVAAVGVLSAAAAAAYAPAAPGPGMCWYYTDQSYRAGYWAACY